MAFVWSVFNNIHDFISSAIHFFQLQIIYHCYKSAQWTGSISRKKNENKFEKHFYRFMGCCLSYVIVHSRKCLHCIQSSWEIYKHCKIVLHLDAHMCHHELHIEQFDLFLEEQSFTHRRNKDTKDIEKSSCQILSKDFIVIGLLCLAIIWCSSIFKHISYNKYYNCQMTFTLGSKF